MGRTHDCNGHAIRQRLTRWAVTLGLTVTTLGAGTAAESANLVTNGSFEQPVDNGTLVYASIPGWTLVSGGLGFFEVSAASTYGVSGQDGVQVCELSSHSNYRIKQTLTTIPGAKYRLTFLTARRVGTAPDTNRIRAYWNGVQIADLLPSSTVMASNTYFVTATGSSADLEFEGGGPGDGDRVGSILDAVAVGPTPVQIDIKPGSTINSINLGAKGSVPVAILTTPDFNATTALIDLETLRFAGAQLRVKPNGSFQASEEDVNGDGILDLLLHFETQELDLTADDVSATLTGQLTDGTLFIGTDTIRVVPEN